MVPPYPLLIFPEEEYRQNAREVISYQIFNLYFIMYYDNKIYCKL